MIRDHARHHGLADRHGADADARIVAALGRDFGLVAVTVDGAARGKDGGRRLDGKARHHRLPGGNAAQNAAGIIGQEDRLAVVAHAHFVAILLAGKLSGAKAGADLDALDRVDAHQRRGQIAVELAVDRRAQPRRHAVGYDFDHRADRRAGFAHAVEIIGKERGLVRIGTEERIALDFGPVPLGAIDPMRPHLHQRAVHLHPGHDFPRDGARRDPRRGLARRLPAAAAIIAQAVFDVVSVVGVTGPILVLDIGIILRALIDIVDDERDRRSGRHLLAARFIDEYAGQDSYRVRLLALGGETRLARPALIEIGLDVGLAQRNARRAAVDHAADRRPVALAEGRHPKHMAERIERHRVRLRAPMTRIDAEWLGTLRAGLVARAYHGSNASAPAA